MFAHDGILIETLKLEESINNVVGRRIYPDRAKARVSKPYIIYNMVGGDPYYHHGGRNTIRNNILPFYAISELDSTALAICELLLSALEGYQGTIIGVATDQAHISFVKLLDEIDGGEYDPKDGSDGYTFYRRLVVEIVWQYA